VKYVVAKLRKDGGTSFLTAGGNWVYDVDKAYKYSTRTRAVQAVRSELPTTLPVVIYEAEIVLRVAKGKSNFLPGEKLK